MYRRQRERELERDGDRLREREWDSRESQSKRPHSRHERDPTSPKRSRRDGNAVAERAHGRNKQTEIAGSTRLAGQEQKLRGSLKNALPLEASPGPHDKQSDIGIKGLDKNADGLSVGAKFSSNETEAQRSQYFQHDEREGAGSGDRRFPPRKTTSGFGKWTDRNEQLGDRTHGKTDLHERRRFHAAEDEKNSGWRHDGFFELEADLPPPPARKRPAFSENATNNKPPPPAESDPVAAAATKSPTGAAGNATRLPSLENQRRAQDTSARREDGRGYNNFRAPDINRSGGRAYNRADERWHTRRRLDDGPSSGRGDQRAYQYPPPRDSGYGGGEGLRGRDRFFNGGRQGGERGMHYYPRGGGGGGFQGEKWKHDLFDEANKSPTPKNEDEQIARVEALLAS